MFSEKLLPIEGAVQLLYELGFSDSGRVYELSNDYSIDTLRMFLDFFKKNVAEN